MDVPASECGAKSDSSCMRETLILGNPAIWWTGVVAMIVATAAWIRTRRWEYSLPVVGLIATWVPWLPILDRPIFSFYAVATLPFILIAVALTLRAACEDAETSRQRKQAAFTVGALMMLGVAFVGTVQNPYTAVALLSLAGFAHQTLSVTVITMASDLFKRSEVATVAGMAGTCGNAGVLLFSLLMGALVTRLGYTPFFVGLAALDLVGAVVLWSVVRETGHAVTAAAA